MTDVSNTPDAKAAKAPETVAAAGDNSRKKVPVYCYQCVAGPDLLKVEVEDGVAMRVESNFDITGEHPGGGRVCVKAYGLVQKTYNPNRIQQPMKRTNPKKGREEDPGFVPISWDEALDIVADRMKEMRAKGLRDGSGFPRLAMTTGGGGTPVQYMGSWPAFLSAWGAIDQGYGAGQGVKCYHSEHLYGELWHRAFTISQDTPYTEYIINCGHNIEAASGPAGVWREANARERGIKRVQVEPHLSVTGALSAEWVPIKPKTDAAFLYALIHRIIVERDWEEICDIPFLGDDTNSPYLVGPNGYFLRDPQSRKPLIWDLSDNTAKTYDALINKPALGGIYTVTGVEEGPDDQEWSHSNIEAGTSFQKLIEHVTPYSPEWAAETCDIPAENIRRIADEFVAHARIGETIEIDGETLPFRPVSIMLGKSVNNGWGGYNCCWARTVLCTLVGALEVPGGTLGTAVKLNRPADNRKKSATPGPDGFMHYPFNETSKEGWQKDPKIRNGYNTLVPLAADSPWSAALGPAHLPWLFQKKQPENWPKQTNPDMWICYRTNPSISHWNGPEIAKRIAEFPFVVAFAYTDDETNHFADVLLPEATDLEGMQLIRIGGTKFVQQYWEHHGWAIRQPVAEPVTDIMDMTDIATELATRVGILEEYNSAINRGAAGMRLKNDKFDYSLDPTVPHTREEIWDSVSKAASHDLSDGEEVHDLEWFKENSHMLAPFSQLEWYLYPALKKQGLRFELPYQERIKRHGTQLSNRLHENDIKWWDSQLEEYEPLPSWEPFPEIWQNYAKEVGKNPDDYQFWALTARSMQYSWGANVGLPLIKEVADNVAGHKGVIMNREAGKKLGLEDGDPIVLESPTGTSEGYAVFKAGIRPDTILMIGQFDHWKQPVAKDFKLASLNSLSDISLSLTDGTGSGADLVRVKITRGKGPKRDLT